MIKKTIVAMMALTLHFSVSAQQNALDFDGIDDYVTLDDLGIPMAGAGEKMIQMWIKADKDEQSGIRTAFFSINSNAGANKLIFNMGGVSSQDGRFMIYNSSGLVFNSPTIIGDNACHHILYINSGDFSRVWIDGIYEGMYNEFLNLNSTDRYSLGQEWDNAIPSDFFNGSIDEFSIWNAPYNPTITGLPGSINNTYLGSEPGLVGYYPFNQGIPLGNNLTVNQLFDSSFPTYDGHLNNFSLNGPGTVTGISNWVASECTQGPCSNANELDFDGDDDYVNLNNIQSDMAGIDEFTLEFWMRADLTDQASVRSPLFAVNGSTGTQNKFMIILGGTASNTGNLMITDLNAWGATNDFLSTQVIGDNECHHIAYSREGNLGSIYIDGILVGTHAISYAFTAADLFSLGQEYDGAAPSQFYNGMMDEFRIWTTVRTATEIAANMATELTGTEPGLLTYYNFNQGISAGMNPTVTDLIDITSGNDGLLTNFALSGTNSNWLEQGCASCEADPCSNANELDFDGDDDYVNLNNIQSDMAGLTEFTLEFWMRADFTDQASVRSPLFAVNGSTGTQNKFMIILGGTGSNTGNLMITDLNAWGATNDFLSANVIGDNRCHHIAYSREGNTGSIYIDGVLVGTHAISYAFTASDLFSLGQEYDGTTPSQFYNGMMDEFRIWTTVRTAAEINANMLAPLTGTETGLLSYYDFNQGISGGSNPTVDDLVDITSGNDGLLIDFALDGVASNWLEQSCADCEAIPSQVEGIEEREARNVEDSDNRMQDNQLLSVFPNPANDRITVQFENGINDNATIRLTDLTGKVVFEHSFDGSIVIDTHDLQSGVYLVTMVNNNNIITKRVIIN